MPKVEHHAGAIIEAMSNEDYHKHHAYSNTNLSHLYDYSPKHMKVWKEETKEATPAQIKGIAIHHCVLEFEQYERNYVIWSGHKRGKKWDEFSQEHGDKYIISVTDDTDCRAAREAVMAHPFARRLVEDAKMVEVSAFAEIMGLPGKARPDIVTHKDWLVDLKSTSHARPDRFGISIENFNYDRQFSWYHDIWAKAHDLYIDVTRFVTMWIAVESSTPYAVSVLECTNEMLLFGRQAYQQIIQIIRNCIDGDTFPAYSDDPMPATYPPWSKRGRGDLYG
jgi:hypothetical protein